MLYLQLRALHVILPEREYAFHPVRRWRFDFAWPELRLAVEVEGGVYSQGRHNRPQGFIGDTEKYNAAAEAGWTVLRYTGTAIRSGNAVEQVRTMIHERQASEPSNRSEPTRRSPTARA
jgi:very-short-patch-repair endonuclease